MSLITEIAAPSHEQASGVEQVNQALSDMDTGTLENAALIEKAASASRELESRA